MRKRDYFTDESTPRMMVIGGQMMPRGPVRTNPFAPQATDTRLGWLISGFGSPGASNITATIEQIGRVPYYP